MRTIIFFFIAMAIFVFKLYSQQLVVEEIPDIRITYVYYHDPVTGEQKNLIMDTLKSELGRIINVKKRVYNLEQSSQMIEIGTPYNELQLFTINIPNTLGINLIPLNYHYDASSFQFEFNSGIYKISIYDIPFKFDALAINNEKATGLDFNQIEISGIGITNGIISYKINDTLKIDCLKCIKLSH